MPSWAIQKNPGTESRAGTGQNMRHSYLMQIDIVCQCLDLPIFHRNSPLLVGAKVTDFSTASSFTLSWGG